MLNTPAWEYVCIAPAAAKLFGWRGRAGNVSKLIVIGAAAAGPPNDKVSAASTKMTARAATAQLARGGESNRLIVVMIFSSHLVKFLRRIGVCGGRRRRQICRWCRNGRADGQRAVRRRTAGDRRTGTAAAAEEAAEGPGAPAQGAGHQNVVR